MSESDDKCATKNFAKALRQFISGQQARNQNVLFLHYKTEKPLVF